MSTYELTIAPRDEVPNAPPIQVANVLRQLQHSSIPERGISVAIEVDESLHVNADELRLSLTVGKLLQKAIRSSPAGAHVVMRSRVDDAGVVIEVDDERGSTLSLAFPSARPTRTPSWPPSHR